MKKSLLLPDLNGSYLCWYDTHEECFLHHANDIKVLMDEFEKGSEAIERALEDARNKEKDLTEEYENLQKWSRNIFFSEIYNKTHIFTSCNIRVI